MNLQEAEQKVQSEALLLRAMVRQGRKGARAVQVASEDEVEMLQQQLDAARMQLAHVSRKDVDGKRERTRDI